MSKILDKGDGAFRPFKRSNKEAVEGSMADGSHPSCKNCSPCPDCKQESNYKKDPCETCNSTHFIPNKDFYE